MSINRKQRTPLLLATFVGGGALFIGLKWRAVLQKSEAAKLATTRTGSGKADVNYSVDAGRSGKFRHLAYGYLVEV